MLISISAGALLRESDRYHHDLRDVRRSTLLHPPCAIPEIWQICKGSVANLMRATYNVLRQHQHSFGLSLNGRRVLVLP